MTRRLPPKDLDGNKAIMSAAVSAAIGEMFAGAPAWQLRAALAALYRLRPELGAPDDLDHELHLCMWWRDPDYFLRVCRLLRHYGVGSQWGY